MNAPTSSTQLEPLVLRAQADGIVRLTLNRPAHFNSLS